MTPAAHGDGVGHDALPGNGWLRLQSDAVRMLAATECFLGTHRLELDPDIREGLTNLARAGLVGGAEARRLLLYIDVWVDLRPLQARTHLLLAQSSRNETLAFFVRRQMPFALLHELFGITAHEAAAIRKELRVSAPPARPKLIDPLAASRAWAVWSKARARETDAVRLWRHIADALPDLELASLYRFLIKEAQ